MKHLVISILAAVAVVFSGYGQDESDEPMPIPFVLTGTVGAPIFRAPALVPVHGYYYPSMCAVYITFAYPMESAAFCAENLETGEQLSGILSSENGVGIIPVWGTPGYYAIAITTAGGQQYIGQFDIE